MQQDGPEEFVIAMRFAFRGHSGWKSEFSQSGELLFTPERLQRRLALLEKVALASLADQTDRGFHLYVLTSADLPGFAMERLRALCAEKLGEGRYTIAAERPGNARKYLRRFLAARNGETAVHLVLDDDDGLARDFIADLRDRIAQMDRPEDPARPRFVSYAAGYALVFEGGRIESPEIYAHNYPYINLGLTMIGPKGGQNLFSISHRKAPKRFGCLVLRHQPMFLRSVHGDNDSRVEIEPKWRARPDWREDAELLDRFPCLGALK